MKKSNIYYTFKKTPIGDVTIVWETVPVPRLLYIKLDGEELSEDILAGEKCSLEECPGFIKSLIETLDLYFDKKKSISYPVHYLRMGDLSFFAKKVLFALLDVPFGKLVSYKELAEMAGFPMAYRAVGNIMNKNPFPLIIPCHRVIKEDGSIGGFAPGTGLKKILLEHEGSLGLIK